MIEINEMKKEISTFRENLQGFNKIFEVLKKLEKDITEYSEKSEYHLEEYNKSCVYFEKIGKDMKSSFNEQSNKQLNDTVKSMNNTINSIDDAVVSMDDTVERMLNIKSVLTDDKLLDKIVKKTMSDYRINYNILEELVTNSSQKIIENQNLLVSLIESIEISIKSQNNIDNELMMIGNKIDKGISRTEEKLNERINLLITISLISISLTIISLAIGLNLI